MSSRPKSHKREVRHAASSHKRTHATKKRASHKHHDKRRIHGGIPAPGPSVRTEPARPTSLRGTAARSLGSAPPVPQPFTARPANQGRSTTYVGEHALPGSTRMLTPHRAARGSGDAAFAVAWARAMADPFQHVPEPMGTAVGSIVFTNTLQFEAEMIDGWFAAALLPRGLEALMLNWSMSGGTPGTWSTVSMAGDTNLAAGFNEGRPLAAGLKYVIRTASDVVPGYSTMGNLPCPAATTEITGLNGNTLLTRTGMVDCGSSLSGVVTWRPLDEQDGEFTTLMTSSSTDYMTSNYTTMVLSQWPAGTFVRVTAIWHIEVILKPNYYTGMLQAFSTEEHTWGVILDFAHAVARTAYGNIITLGSAVLMEHALRSVRGGPYALRPPTTATLTMPGRPTDPRAVTPKPVVKPSYRVDKLLEFVMPPATQAAMDALREQLRAVGIVLPDGTVRRLADPGAGESASAAAPSAVPTPVLLAACDDPEEEAAILAARAAVRARRSRARAVSHLAQADDDSDGLDIASLGPLRSSPNPGREVTPIVHRASSHK